MAITPSEYARAAKIKISTGQIDSTQTNLPVVLTHLLTDFPADLLDPASGTPALNGGADLRICTDLAGTNELPIHVLCCVVDATAGLRKFVAFTTIPTALDGTEIYLFWGKAGATAYAATDPYGRNAVYLNWEMVTHDLTEECTGNYPGAFTVGGNPTQVDGPWGNPNGAYLFDGNDYITLATGGRLPFDGVAGDADMHVLGWLDCQSTGNYQRAMHIAQVNKGFLQFGANANDTGSFFVCGLDNTGVKRPNKIPMTPNTGWHLCQANVEYSINGAGETADAEQWIDTAFGQGVEGSISAGYGANETSINFGRRNNNTQHYTGKGAGFWFHKTARPTDFVTAMGRNQTDQAGWASVVATYTPSTDMVVTVGLQVGDDYTEISDALNDVPSDLTVLPGNWIIKVRNDKTYARFTLPPITMDANHRVIITAYEGDEADGTGAGTTIESNSGLGVIRGDTSASSYFTLRNVAVKQTGTSRAILIYGNYWEIKNCFIKSADGDPIEVANGHGVGAVLDNLILVNTSGTMCLDWSTGDTGTTRTINRVTAIGGTVVCFDRSSSTEEQARKENYTNCLAFPNGGQGWPDVSTTSRVFDSDFNASSDTTATSASLTTSFPNRVITDDLEDPNGATPNYNLKATSTLKGAGIGGSDIGAFLPAPAGGVTSVTTNHNIVVDLQAKVETPYNVVMNLGTISQVITDHVIAMNLQQTSTTDYNIIANLTTAVETAYNISTDFIGRTLTQYLMNMNFDGVSSDVWYPATYKQDFARPYELNLDDKLGRVLDCCLVFEDAGTIGSQPTTIESINSGYDHDVAMTYNTTGKLVGDGAMRFTRDAGTKGVLAGANSIWASNAQDKSRIYLCDFKVYSLPPSGSDYVWAAAGFVVVIAANGDVELRYRSQSGAYYASFFAGMAAAGKRLRVVGQLNKTVDTVISRINGVSPTYEVPNSFVFDDSGTTGQPRYSETGVGGNGSIGFEGHINACGFGVNFNGEELSIDDITTASQADYPYLTLATVEENVRCLKWGTGLSRQEGLELTGLVGVLTIELELAEDMPAFFTNTTSYLFDGRRTAGTSASDGSNTWLHTSSTGSGITNLKINGTASDATGFKSAVAGDVLSFTVTGAGDAVLIGNRYDHFNYAIEGLALSSVRVRDDNGLHVFMLDLSEGDVVNSETSANVANLCNFGSGSGYVTDSNGDIVGFIGGNSRYGAMAEWAADSAFTISGSFKTPAVIPPVAYLFGRGDNYAEYIAFNTSEIIVRIGSNSYNLAAPVANTEYTLTITRDVSNNINIDLNGTPYGPFVNAATARFSMAFGGSTDIDSGEVTLLGNWQFTRTGDDRLYDFTGGDIKRVRDLNGVADMTIVTASEQKWTEVTPKRYSSLGTGRDYATMAALKTALQNDDSEHHVVDWYGTTEDTIAVHFSDNVFDSGITFRAAPGHEASFAAVNGAAATMPYALYTYACPVKFENIKFDVALYGRNIHLDGTVFSSTAILRNAAGNPATHGRGYGLIRNSLVNHVQVDFDAQYVFEDAHIMGTVTQTAGDLALVNTILSSTASPHTFSAGSLSISNVYMARSQTPTTESISDFTSGVDMSAWFNNTAGGDWRIKQGIRDSEFIGKGYHASDMCSAFYMAGEALSQVITDYNMLMSLSQQVTTDHQIVANVLGRIVTNYNLLADLLGRVNTDQQHVFNLLGQVVTNMNYDFSLTQAASTTMAYSFDMMGQVETSQDYRFNLLGSVEAQQNYVLNLLQAAEADMAYRLDMNTQVSTDMNYQLSLRQLVETSYDLVVNYLGRITTDFGVALDLLETKEASYAVDIDLLSQAITDQQIVINALEQRQTTQSINLALLEQAYVDHQQLMDFRQRVQEDYQVLVDLNQRGQSTYQMWMDFLASVEGETDYTILLNFLESVTVDQSAVINLLQRELASQNYDLTFVGRVETDHQAVMNLIGRVEANQTYALDFFQRVEKSFEYRFNLLQSGGAETDYSIILDLRQRLETEFAVDLQLLQRETGDHTIVADLLNTVTMDFVNRLELLGRVETDFTVSLKYLARSETTYDVVFDVDSDILPMRPLHYVVGAQTKIMFSAGPDTLTFYAGDEDDDSTTIKI